MITWTNVTRKLGELQPWPRNPRQIKSDQARRLAESFDAFGQVETIAIGPDNEVYNGHQRLNVLMAKHGADYVVECRQASRALTEKEREKLTVFLHKGAAGEWDFDILANEFEVDDLLEWGFEPFELGIDDKPELGEDTEPQVNRAEELREQWGVEPGQIWRLPSRVAGQEHRLVCGDCTDAEVVARVMGGERAACMWTDPPYAIYGSSTGVSGDIADDNMVRPFFREILKACKTNVVEFGHVYICCDFRSWSAWWQECRAVGLAVKNCIIWDKQTPGMGSMYRNQHEFLLFAVNYHQDTTFMSKKKAGQQKVIDGNVWSIQRHNSADKEHNAQKPMELVERALGNSTETGEIVYEPFSGSGTTIIACENLGRKCRAIEINPAYVAVALQRWADHTGRTPVRIE